MESMKNIYKTVRNFAAYVDGLRDGHSMSHKAMLHAANEALLIVSEIIPGSEMSHALEIAEAVVHGKSLVDYLSDPKSLRSNLDREYADITLYRFAN